MKFGFLSKCLSCIENSGTDSLADVAFKWQANLNETSRGPYRDRRQSEVLTGVVTSLIY